MEIMKRMPLKIMMKHPMILYLMNQVKRSVVKNT
jgi:hypothetical protein